MGSSAAAAAAATGTATDQAEAQAPVRTRRQELAEAKAAHNHPAYAKMAFVMGCGVQGAGTGSTVLDRDGRAFLALFDQYGNQSFGYSHPQILAAVREQLDTGRLNSTKIMFEEEQILLTERLAALTGGRLPFAYLANGGGESIDNALKLARAATRKPRFVTAVDCFHGKTFATLSASGRPEHEAVFSPLMEGFAQVPFGDVAALARELAAGDVAAVLLEPVQAEGGVVPPPPGYLSEVRRLCTEAGALLILDEMQTAFGRCGTFFAFEQFDVVPDLICVGKAFGGGLVPISAVLGTEEAWACLKALPSTFGSSLGGNPLSCRVGLESIAIASDPEFLAAVRTKGAVITARLSALAQKYPALITAHRGLGMMHGLELRDEASAGLVLALLLEHQVTSTYSLYKDTVVRIQPPMVISDEELERGLDILAEVLARADAYLAASATAAAETDQAAEAPTRPVRRTVRLLNVEAARVHALLAAHPHLLDPFARWPDAAAEPADATADGEFAGVVGEDDVVWTDVAELTDSGVVLRAREDWLWTRLERSVRVDAAPGGCEVDVVVDWDTGTGPYEELLGGRIGHFAASRLDGLLTRLRDRFDEARDEARDEDSEETHSAQEPPVKLSELTDRYARNTTSVLIEIDTAGARTELSYAALAQRVAARAAELEKAGVAAGHVIAIRARNSVDWVVWDLAALQVGAVLQALPDELPLGDLEEFGDRHGLAFLVTDQPGEEDPAWVVATAAPLDGRAARTGARAGEEAGLHSLVYSSGTTGGLKGLRISGPGTEYVINRFLDCFPITAADRHLIFLPLANYQQRLSVYCCLWTGADLVLAPYQRVFGALRAESPTFVIGPPVFYDAVLQLFGKAGGGASLGEFLGGKVRFMITGMAPIRRAVLEAYWSAGIKLLEAYGMTESGMIAWNTEE
ncbi:aminotransferase class III-fold pyridoxal phosphate-dependent enzyme, partial [Actinospica durhamensis]